MSSDFLSLQHPALTRLDQWISEGWMRPLDRALAAMDKTGVVETTPVAIRIEEV